MNTLLLIIGLMAYDSEGGGGVSHINIHQQYNSVEQCELILNKYTKAYDEMSDGRFVNVELFEKSCTKLGDI